MLDPSLSSILTGCSGRVLPFMGFRARIEEVLTETGLSQADLARAAGITRSAVNQWFTGDTKNPRPEHIVAVADATGYTIRWLAAGQGIKKDQPSSLSQARLLWERYQKAQPETRGAIDILLNLPPAGTATGTDNPTR